MWVGGSGCGIGGWGVGGWGGVESVTCGAEACKSPHGGPGGWVSRLMAPGLCEAGVGQGPGTGLHVESPQGGPSMGALRVQV